MKKVAILFVSLLIMAMGQSCFGAKTPSDPVGTFTKLYGYVRWFYPSNEASELDWNRFAVYGNALITYPKANQSSFERLAEALKTMQDSTLTIQNKTVQLANVVIAWNIYQHFYPYFDVVDVDWDQVLTKTLKDVYADSTEVDYYKTLCGMVAASKDGHGVIWTKTIKSWGLPFRVDLVEGKIVVVESLFPDYMPGDIIVQLDDKPAMDELIYQESLISGSPQLKRRRGLNMFSADYARTIAKVVLIRDGVEKEYQCRRYNEYNLYLNPNQRVKNRSMALGDDIAYLTGDQTNFDALLPKIKTAKKLIVSKDFTLEWDLIPHLIKDALWSPWWNIPVVTHPDAEQVTYFLDRWQFKPKEPFLDAKVVFINSPERISSGETIMSFVDFYHLGETVGDTTAGTNGDVNKIRLWGDYTISMTGLKVLKHAQTQLHLKGYVPNYPVERTIQAIKDGRDEYVEKAVEVLKKNLRTADSTDK